MLAKPTYDELEQKVRHLEGLISSLRHKEESLLIGEKRLAQIIQGSPIPTFVMDKRHVITHCNQAYEKLRGIPADDIIGTHGGWLDGDSTETSFMADHIVDGAPEEEMVWYYGGKCRKSKAVEGAYEAEVFFPELGPEGRWLFLTAAPLLDSEGGIIGAIETLQDITERREAEEALRASEKRLYQIVQGNPIPIFVIDANHSITHCNRALENLTGIQAQDIVGTRGQWVHFYASPRPVMADFVLDRAPNTDMYRYYGESLRQSAVIDGAYEAEGFFAEVGEKGRWLFFTAAPLMDDEGKVVGAIETLQDVTERKVAEEAMRKSERRYHTLLDFAPYPIVVFSLDGLVS
ncbi:MAG: PAS domain-containing protein, partial [Deltaproteobacteria bacterium]|nr:PAS domain-containing protein [Deltaproteobacteria bacterium]